jgi:hypothetical protein
MWILPFRIFSRVDVSGCIKTLLRETISSSPDQGFTLLRARVSSASSMTSAASTRERSSVIWTTYEDLRILKSVVKPQDYMLSLDVESTFFHVPIHPKHRKFFSSHLTLTLFVKNKVIEL